MIRLPNGRRLLHGCLVGGWLGGSLGACAVNAQADVLPSLGVPVRQSSGASGLNLAVPVAVNGPMEFALESSEDLGGWKTLWNYSFREGTDTLLVADPNPLSGAGRFYRVRSPGDSLDDLETAWVNQGLVSYRFRYEPRIGFCNCVKSATITVVNGVVTDVSDAILATGFPLPNPNPADFRSIEQLFESVRGYQRSQNYLWVRIAYDPDRRFPRDVLLGGHPDGFKGFTISQVEILQR